MRIAPRLAAATCAAALLTTGLVASADAATPALKFMRFYADQPGTDSLTTTLINREYIQIKNTTRTTQSLSGWVVKDAKSKHVYKFPSTFKLAAGKMVTLHSGTGRNTATDLYWGNKGYVWNNTGDTAYLLKGSTRVHTCVYKPTATQLKNKSGYVDCP